MKKVLHMLAILLVGFVSVQAYVEEFVQDEPVIVYDNDDYGYDGYDDGYIDGGGLFFGFGDGGYYGGGRGYGHGGGGFHGGGHSGGHGGGGHARR